MRALARYVALSSTPAARWATRWLARLALLFRWAAPGRLLERAALSVVRKEAACCRAGSPLFAILERGIDHFERAGVLARARLFLRQDEPRRAAARLDAWLRIGLLGWLRHEVLARHLGAPGVPPRLLVQAQIALSSACDLECEGCYTADERRGRAPDRSAIAALVDEAVLCGAFAVHVVGKGEPFLSARWAADLLSVIEERPHVFFTIATHGMHIDAALAVRLGDLGNVAVLVAVDGPEALHDARRGAGSYGSVQDALALLREHGALFGFSCMVSGKSHRELTSAAFIRAQAQAGCTFGVYSRYFPLSASENDELVLPGDALEDYRAAFARAQSEAPILLVDFDELERGTGCHSRAGESIYIDGINGQVSPCIRVPFAPADCRVGRSGRSLAEVLHHPFFGAYRGRESDDGPAFCGADLGDELESVRALLPEGTPAAERLDAYRERAKRDALSLPPGPRGSRRLPVLPAER